jgi:hypothetical protein
MSHVGYYRPYESEPEDEEDEDDDDDEEDEESEDETERRRISQDPRYAILRAAGPPMDTQAKQDKYSSQAPGAPFDVTTNIKSLVDHVYLDPPKTTKTSLVTIKSTNRDKRLFPTPFRFQLKLPRVYKDVTKFQLVQMSFPNNASNVQPSTLFTSSFVEKLMNAGVPPQCSTTCISLANCTPASNALAMVEAGRLNSAGEPLLLTLSVPTASYTDSQIAQQLSMQANSTPPLNLISYADFSEVFLTTGDLTILFNEPSDCYVSRTTNQTFGMHSKLDIMKSYYAPSYLECFGGVLDADIALVAYYFPILKEVIATGRAQPFLVLPAGVDYDSAVTAIMGPFQGFDCTVYLEILRLNQGALDAYRPHLTFELRNVNQYNWKWNAETRRYVTIHDQLHPSLRREFTIQSQSALTDQLVLAGLNEVTFATLKNTQTTAQGVARHMERQVSTVLGHMYLAEGVTASAAGYQTATGLLSPAELAGDADFNALFSYRSTFGRTYGAAGGAGVILTFSTFMDYHSTLVGYQTIAASTTVAVSTIYGAAHQNYHAYVASKYSGVLPSSMLASRSYLSQQGIPVSFVTGHTMYMPGMPMRGMEPRAASADLTNTFTTAVDGRTDTPTLGRTYQFSSTLDCSTICCTVIQQMINGWYSGVPVNTVINSMAYRMGVLNMQPGAFNIFSTVSQVTSTSNLNLLLSINNEQGFNNMDLTMPEDYSKTSDPTGQVKLIAGKILMETVGNSGVSQTVIQNPTVFENALGKLDKLDIRIYYDDEAITPAWLYLPYFLSIEEWNATFQIDEQVGFANQNTGWGPRPSIPVPENPDSTPYLNFTHKNNPNNS